jgi:acyl-CoA synthetase (AMP-forming)/AMP-acid ligase II
VGIPDEKWGETVAAAVVPKYGQGQDIGEENLRQHCKRHLHNWKCPKKILFVNSLPRNTMGKVLKEEVKKLFEK